MTTMTKAAKPKKPTPKAEAATTTSTTKGRASQSETKGDAIQRLLKRKDGATVAQMTMATGWQAHSVRGFISGTLKKKLGLNVTSVKAGAERFYRIEPAA